ncbi:YebC/PmpR family DNA-binding transcriptional regulator [Candidatus Arthromitus sp. SFB-rat-Yit]|uniref:YebC/PmpR family DNA-binding transcriptional regulator n=1 Tax=Candidatus Arthromitus sp. SFB-rat-Yit TaxID=1041504 RepID=UPI000227A16F|nr:YebC/PmpR family DNA-binding transcriptional regulator [Candidatus Arthromitus sp. SFB-rat-Yit]BAK81293.1 hypothetical protein RATSFB_0731 [Candidatus Arthromitus sp. SFB-rat-Yit]
MSGHSKWHNIQARKSKVDSKRSKIFTKLVKEISVAAKMGGSSIEGNSKLKDAIEKAQYNNIPKETIERAIKKGAGELSGDNYENLVYEGYGPFGVAVIVKALTDNKNRTAGNVRHIFSKFSGNLGSSGCVSYMFKEVGEIVVDSSQDISEDEIMEIAFNCGADDFQTHESDNVYVIKSSVENFKKIKEELESENIDFLEAEVMLQADTNVFLDSDEKINIIEKFIDALEDDDDVQEVFCNAEYEIDN